MIWWLMINDWFMLSPHMFVFGCFCLGTRIVIRVIGMFSSFCWEVLCFKILWHHPGSEPQNLSRMVWDDPSTCKARACLYRAFQAATDILTSSVWSRLALALAWYCFCGTLAGFFWLRRWCIISHPWSSVSLWFFGQLCFFRGDASDGAWKPSVAKGCDVCAKFWRSSLPRHPNSWSFWTCQRRQQRLIKWDKTLAWSDSRCLQRWSILMVCYRMAFWAGGPVRANLLQFCYQIIGRMILKQSPNMWNESASSARLGCYFRFFQLQWIRAKVGCQSDFGGALSTVDGWWLGSKSFWPFGTWFARNRRWG